MRPLRFELLAVAVALAGCESGPAADAGAARASQERVCAMVVAEHVGMAPGEVTATWDRATPEGTAIVTVDAPGRPHSCEVDAGSRVLEILHTEA